MESIMSLLSGFRTALSMGNLIYCFIGVVYGLLVGVLPGLGATAGMAILLPITFGLTRISAIILLSGIYYGSMYGGAITAILINVPGTAAAVITCLDGHPLAKQGRAGTALAVAGVSSFTGSLFSMLLLALVAPMIAKVALKFGPAEFFAIIFLGLTLLTGLMGKSILKGLIAAMLGLMLAMVGSDPLTGHVRFAFGQTNLAGGIDLIALCIGLFGMSELFQNVEEQSEAGEPIKIQGLLPRREEWRPTLKAMARGSGIGAILGFVPGSGAVIPTLLSYSLEKKLAKDPSRFGKGALEGIAGPESANNSYSVSSLIPLFTLGIPGSSVMAVLFGAFVMHGLTPGPLLFVNEPHIVWGVIASMFIGNFILLFLSVPLAGFWAKITQIPNKLLFPIIIIVSILGIYAVNNNMWDVGVMFMFGFIGYVLKKIEFPVAPIVLTFVLANLLETSLAQALTIFRGDFFKFFRQPISATILILSMVIFVGSAILGVLNKRSIKKESKV